ncbi:MAG: class II glutamine amidotransferase [Myxococcaceae bacterium]
MSFAIAVYTSDPNLLRCELARLNEDVELDLRSPEPMGAGWYSDSNVLLQRYASTVRPESLELLGPDLESEALIVHSSALPLGLSPEENTQPFRFRSWLFAHLGKISGPQFRSGVQELLPGFLARSVKGSTESEWVFALFLAQMREIGHIDDPGLAPLTSAQVLGKTARTVEKLSGARGDALNLLATNDHVLLAARLGPEPMYFRLLEGMPTCDLHKLDGSAESQAAVREHLRRRSVVVATRVTNPAGWIEIESGTSIGVGRNLHVEQVRF